MDLTPYKYDQIMETRKWSQMIPYLQFPNDWLVKIIPPFGGATIRFLVKKDIASVSIYLDCYSNLGCMDEPYWEIYPYEDDTFRCPLNESETLLNAIKQSLESQLLK